LTLTPIRVANYWPLPDASQTFLQPTEDKTSLTAVVNHDTL
jgi:hypothetical protein